ncbi:response regulator [Microvirga sp. GCM10011540]|uniref:response regulator n=1 Tax=Microvirga sp. GCM10011540 TaxID=3317338 RepID=UPI00361844E5
MSATTVTAFPRRTPPAILVIEDDALTRCLISDELRARGFKVLEASAAHDAILVLDAVRIDLLFIDLHLPGVRSGLDVARLVRSRKLPIQMVLTSGKAIPSEHDLSDLGPFIRKPYLAARVIDLVSRCLNWPDAPQP